MAKKKADSVVAEISDDSKSGVELTKRAIQKKYGSVLSKLGDHRDMRIQTISTGSIGLDVALGRGGFAMGRIYEIYGHPSSGKTTLAMSVIAEAQRCGMECVFCDAEHSADPLLFESMGVNINELESIKAYSGDENLDALEMLIKTGAFGVAVVDSVSALIPKEEAEGEMEDKFIGLLARLMSKACRKFAQLCSETNTLLIFINQTRNKIGGYGDPTTTTGGEALNFYATGRIKVSGGESKASRIVSVTGEVIGHKTYFEIRKNKLAPPHRSAEIPLIYGVGYDSHWEVLSIAHGLGIVDRTGAWFKYNDQNIGNGELATISFLKENVGVYNEIRNKIIEDKILCPPLGLKALYEQNV